MSVAPWVMGLASAASIVTGGVTAVYWARRPGLISAFAAATMLAIAFINLLPSAAEVVSGLWLALIPLGFILGLAGFHFFSRVGWMNLWGPGWMFGHAVVDGLLIGIGFSVSWQLGLLLSLGLVAHGFMHGINTIVLAQRRHPRLWLTVNALAPLIGLFLSRYLRLSDDALAIILSVMAGGFTYLGAVHLRESLNSGRRGTSLAMLLGVVMIVGVRLIAH